MALTKKQIAAIIILIVSIALCIVLIVLTTRELNNSASPRSCPPSPGPSPPCPVCRDCPTPSPVSSPTPASVPAPAPVCVPGCTTDVGKRYVGAASENIQGPGGIRLSTAAECKTKCEANPECKQYVFYDPNKLCYLQTTVHSDPPIVASGFTSGYCKRC